jgi:hypothetical protein
MKPVPSNLTVARLHEVLEYDKHTGIFKWKVKIAKRISIGAYAGSKNKSSGYIGIMVDGQSYVASRLAWFYTHGKWPAMYIDHKNGDTGDNRLCNLREANQSQNMANVHVLRKNNTSGVKGVAQRENGKWGALIRTHGRARRLGSFDTMEEAKAAYDAALVKDYGEFAKVLN